MNTVKQTPYNIILIDLANYLIDNYAQLVFSMSTGCRCGSCESWKVIDYDDVILLEEDDLITLVDKIIKQNEDTTL